MISAKCITYGRVEFLEESLYSFLNQDYDGESEMIIVNDYPLQELIFDHPRVRIFNLKETFDHLGDKENYATSLCKGDIIAQWDDDDVALPNHLKNIEKYFVPGTDLLQWANGIFMSGRQIAAIHSVGNSGIVYSRDCWNKIGGYPKENAGYDMSFVMKIRGMEGVDFKQVITPREEASWIYMWANGTYHCSGAGTDTPDRPNVIVRHSDHIESLRKQGKIPTGKVYLNPHWKQDYVQNLKDFIENGK